ncbi:hypothetical protein B1A87_007450 [Arthrobacter sp. KBS0703]|uniref:hypothetical protein n=1 Tax=Arthrobacter sp. KBS0703 TaxID=1955698 RepID=UPI0011864CC3|nr:hypothetical protein [Arthrobacter sp. KBS0703]TSE15757.1 hypothetical protein B1A87_007450 [Arthrobacter sp. KBS0703]
MNFSIDSTANVVAYDAGGTLWSYTSVSQGLQTAARRAIGPAGAALPKALFVSDWNADAVPDLIVQNKNGTLTYREGIITGGFTDSTIGSGWQNYEITVGEWKRTDKYPSIIARNNATGELFNYGNPSGKNLSPRVKIGVGWNGLSFNLLDWDKDGNNDVVAKNAAGQMKLFRASGGGSFISEARATIGSGWNSMTSIRAISGLGPYGSVGLMAQACCIITRRTRAAGRLGRRSPTAGAPTPSRATNSSLPPSSTRWGVLWALERKIGD